MAEAESRRAADAAEQAYRETFDRSVIADEGALRAEHARALAAGQAVFMEAAVGTSHSSLLGGSLKQLMRIGWDPSAAFMHGNVLVQMAGHM